MLSLGTEVFLAFWMASTRVGLPERSAPPIRAATSMFLISFAKALARRESVIAFWCFVVAHLECPDIHLPCACLRSRAGQHAGPGHPGRAEGSAEQLVQGAQVPGCCAGAVSGLAAQLAERARDADGPAG